MNVEKMNGMVKLEYVWLDGYEPTQNLRSKIKIVKDFNGTLEECPKWNFDGSSTKQAEGNSSDCILNPVAVYPNGNNRYIVMNEVLMPSKFHGGTIPDVSNKRCLIKDNDKSFWFGFEQEYFIMDKETHMPLGFPPGGYPRPQGKYYCSVGGKNTYGRDFVEEHTDLCLQAGINIEGTNQEVACGQWEFQIFSKNAKKVGDDLWVARYLLEKLSEKYGWYIEYHPKPIKGDWNGSGMHVNFSNSFLRTCNSRETFFSCCEAFGSPSRIAAHMEAYGAYNVERLTGEHETAHINDFSFGVSDRSASIRIPITTVENDWCGWLEDRRPASNANPYAVVAEIIKTINEWRD